MGEAETPSDVDERLREKELGVLNRLTRVGVEALFRQEAAMRGSIGEFYYRPPSGESWCDVILRLRSLLVDLPARYQPALLGRLSA